MCLQHVLARKCDPDWAARQQSLVLVSPSGGLTPVWKRFDVNVGYHPEGRKVRVWLNSQYYRAKVEANESELWLKKQPQSTAGSTHINCRYRTISGVPNYESGIHSYSSECPDSSLILGSFGLSGAGYHHYASGELCVGAGVWPEDMTAIGLDCQIVTVISNRVYVQGQRGHSGRYDYLSVQVNDESVPWVPCVPSCAFWSGGQGTAVTGWDHLRELLEIHHNTMGNNDA